MAKCKDCLHYEACLTFSKFINAARDVEQGCEHFKDCTEVVEVVRCKDCEYYDYDECVNPYIFMSEGAHLYTDPCDFCSYGERKDNERKAD